MIVIQKLVSVFTMLSFLCCTSLWAVLPPPSPPTYGGYTHYYVYHQNLYNNVRVYYGQYLSTADTGNVGNEIAGNTQIAYGNGDLYKVRQIILNNAALITAANPNSWVLYQHLYNNGYRGSYAQVQSFFTRFSQADRINAVAYVRANSLYSMAMYTANTMKAIANRDPGFIERCHQTSTIAHWLEIVGTASFVFAGETPVGWFGGGLSLGGMIWDLGIAPAIGC